MVSFQQPSFRSRLVSPVKVRTTVHICAIELAVWLVERLVRLSTREGTRLLRRSGIATTVCVGSTGGRGAYGTQPGVSVFLVPASDSRHSNIVTETAIGFRWQHYYRENVERIIGWMTTNWVYELGPGWVLKGLTLVVALLVSPNAYAGPPFQTDDPDPVGFRHYEAYLFGTFDRAGGSTFLQMPAMEFNWGAAPNLQLHLILPGAYVSANGAYGIGDTELGIKYRFVQEGSTCPEIGVFPLVELPTGSNRLGLGNGQVWARLPLWVQKSYGPWTTYGGAGYQINHAPGMKDSVFAGWLLQRQITQRFTVGAEAYHQGAQTVGGRQSTFADAGGYYNFRQNLSLLFMLGHTVSGERHTVGYLGLYYTWGKG